MHLKSKKKFENKPIPLDSYLNPVNSITYTTNVLLGNWYERRITTKVHGAGIVPRLVHDGNCVSAISVYRNDFPTHSDKPTTQEFVDWKQVCHHNRCKGDRSSIRFMDSNEFMHNMSTTNDLFFGTPGSKNRPINSRKVRKKTALDTLQSYGNVHRTGLVEAKRCTDYMDKCRPVNITTYQSNFQLSG